MIDPVFAVVYSDMIHVAVKDGQRSLLMEYLDAHRLRYHAADPDLILIYGKPGQLYKLLVEMSLMYNALVVM